MKKNYSLILGIAICFMLYVVLSWIIPTATISNGAVVAGTTNPIGLFGLVYYPGLTIGTFIQFGLIVLAIGGFYGVMSKTGVYSKIVNGLAEKCAGKEKIFLVIVIALFAVLNSVFGVPFALLILVPFFMEVLLKLGYNKITAVAATVGALLVGSLASTFGYNVAGSASGILGIKITDGILPRVVLLVIVTALFVMFVLSKTKLTVKAKTKKNSKAASKTEDVDYLFLENNESNKKNATPLIILFSLLVIVAIVSMFNWRYIFDIAIFEKLYEDVIAMNIGNYPFLKNLLNLTNPLGYWDSYELVALLVMSSAIIGWIYNLSFKDIYESFIDGAKKVLKPAFYVTIANVLFTFMLSASNGYMLTWITDKLANITEEFNMFAVMLSTMLGGFFYNHFYHLFSSIGQVFMLTSSSDYYSILMFIIESVHGLVMMILPTSLFLVGGLTLLDVSYKDWIKYIWKFLLQILLIVTVITVILVLVV